MTFSLLRCAVQLRWRLNIFTQQSAVCYMLQCILSWCDKWSAPHFQRQAETCLSYSLLSAKHDTSIHQVYGCTPREVWVLWKRQLFLFSVNSPSKLQEKGITYWCVWPPPRGWISCICSLTLYAYWIPPHSEQSEVRRARYNIYECECHLCLALPRHWLPLTASGIILSSPVHMLVSYVLYYSCMSTRRQNDYHFISPTHSLLSLLLPTWFPPILLSCHVDGSSPAPSKDTCTSCQWLTFWTPSETLFYIEP